MGFDRGVTRCQLFLIGLEEDEVLLQHEDVLGAVVTGEGRGDLDLGCLTPMVPMLREGVGIRLARDDVTENAQAGDAGDVADHDGELEVHLDQRLLHALDVGGRALDQGLAMAQVGAQGRNGGGGPEAAAQQAHAMQLLQPLAVHDIGLSAGDILHVPSVHEHDRKAPSLENLVERNPVHAGGFHGHGGHACHQPVRQAMEIRREGLKGTHGRRIPVGGDGNIVCIGAAIDAGGVGVDAVEKGEAV